MGQASGQQSTALESDKWNKIGTIFGVELTTNAEQDQTDEHEQQDHDQTLRDAA